MNVLQALALGLIQGITEWLPISSSGHLAIAQELMKLSVPVAFDVLLHFSSLLVIIIFFRRELADMLRAIFRFNKKSPDFKLALMVIIASIPTAIIGFSLDKLFESAFSNLLIIAIAFIITGFWILISGIRHGENPIGIKSSLLIGIAQGLALVPGISRSGSTISTGLILGIKKEDAFKFSFLLAIPAILGANLFKIRELTLIPFSLSSIIIGLITAFIFGLASLFLLRRIIIGKKFHYFAYYCFIIGLITIIIYFLR